ncbi:MAG TPA: DUF6458 family protein [Thermoleophilaceae bacterium]|nr:DUF6458 family protein [Thermoleophilaceae bacterium]
MTIGSSIVLIAIGAVLRYAVTGEVDWIDIQTVGTILLLVGVLGLILSLLYTFMWSPASRRRREHEYYDDRPPPPTRRY